MNFQQQIPSRAASESTRDHAVALWVAAFATVVLGVGSSIPSFWYDEVATLQLSRLSWPNLWAFIDQRDAVHGVYASIIHVWIRVFGDSELSVRFPSVIASAIAAGGIYLLIRRLEFDLRAAIFGAGIFVLMPRTLIQADEARSYALAVALLVGAALSVIGFAKTGRKRELLSYTVLATFAAWTFVYALLVLPAFAIFAFRTGQRPAQRVLLSFGVIALPSLLTAPLVAKVATQRGQVSWLADQVVNIYTVGLEPFFGVAVWGAAFVVALLAVGVARRSVTWNRVTAALLCWLLLPAILLLLAGVFTDPLFAPRYLTISTPALAVLCAIAVSEWPRKVLLSVSVIGLLVALPMVVMTRIPTAKPSKQDLRAVAEIIRTEGRTGDGFLLATDGVGALRPRVTLYAYPNAFADKQDLAFVESYATQGTYWDEVALPGVNDLAAVRRVWTVTRGDDPYARELERAGFGVSASTTITGLDVELWTR
ncbi:glycosyltransferase family 39 protein [Microbacterium sp.]|uniref:glycosyltransferase family 39 protein n=1 Tax=Microbacterium sp. TaxID=51671 RepID=UPI003A8F1734